MVAKLSDAQVYSAVFDVLGYNTAIFGVPGHAQVMIEVDGNWYTAVGTSFSKIDEFASKHYEDCRVLLV